MKMLMRMGAGGHANSHAGGDGELDETLHCGGKSIAAFSDLFSFESVRSMFRDKKRPSMVDNGKDYRQVVGALG